MKTLLLPLLVVVCLVGDATNQAVTATTNTPPTPAPRLSNISTRAFVQTGDNVLIGGFIVQGTQSKKVIIRAIGPELTQYGVHNALGDPTLELHDRTGALIASNDDWHHTIIGGIITKDQVMDIQNSGHAKDERTAPSEQTCAASGQEPLVPRPLQQSRQQFTMSRHASSRGGFL